MRQSEHMQQLCKVQVPLKQGANYKAVIKQARPRVDCWSKSARSTSNRGITEQTHTDVTPERVKHTPESHERRARANYLVASRT